MLLLWPLISLASVVAADSHAAQHENRLGKRGSTLIPSSCFANDEALYSYFEVGYPWGDHQHHNGAATMLKSQISTAGGYLSLRSTYIGGTGKYTYNSGTVYAKQQFTVPPGGGLDFEASFQAPTQKGCWPAFWLSGATRWPPEIDLAEWKGSGKISFNTFNTSSQVASQDFPYSTPDSWRTVKNELRATGDGKTLEIKFYLDGVLLATQYGLDMVNAPFWFIIDYQMLGSSGRTGPQEPTDFNVRGLTVTSM